MPLNKLWIVLATNIIVFLTVKRGILYTDCFWWSISENLGDASGVQTYNTFKSRKIVEMFIMGRRIHIVNDHDFIRQILDNSPSIFGVGSFKYDFFKSFMPLNVGVSEGCPWRRRRLFNERVLDTNQIPRFIERYRCLVRHSKFPSNHTEFNHAGKKLAMQIVFGLDSIEESVFKIFKEANSLSSILTGESSVSTRTFTHYIRFLRRQIRNPKPGSLVSLMPDNLSEREVIDQIPHWIFPIAGAISNGASRLLVLLSQDPSVLQRSTLRQCIMEMFRLNNPVNSTFRSLLYDYTFDSKHAYKKGTQFLIINNPVMRDKDAFPEPNRFNPTRWTIDLENSYYTLVFNQGPQICPGKEFVIALLEVYIQEYISRYHLLPSYPKIDLMNVPQMINPCTIRIERLEK